MSYYYENKKEPITERLRNYPGSIKTCLAWTLSLMVLYFIFRNDMSSFQKTTTVLIIVLSALSVFICLTTKHSDDITKFKPHLFRLQLIVSLVIFLLSLSATDWKSSGNLGNIIWLAAVFIICSINVALTLRKRRGVESIETWLNELKFIEKLGVIIAFLQLVIAVPQLSRAYELATSSDIDNLMEQQKYHFQRIQNYCMVNIPDSLQNNIVKKIKRVQMRLYTIAIALNDLHPCNTIQTFDLETADKDKRWENLNYYYQAIDKSFTLYTDMQDESEVLFHEIGCIFSDHALCGELADYYDATVNLYSWEKFKNERKENYGKLGSSMQVLLKKHEVLTKNPNVRVPAKYLEEFIDIFCDLSKDKDFNELHKMNYELIYKNIDFLNYVQLYYAYEYKPLKVNPIVQL